MSIHLFNDGTELDVLGDLIPYIKMKKYKPSNLPILDIKNNGLDIALDSPRYLAADTSFPVVVMEKDGEYHLIDGRHRTLKLLNKGEHQISAYILSEYEIDLFRR